MTNFTINPDLIQKLLDASQVGMVITDPKGIALWANDYILNLGGYRMEELIGKKPGKMFQGPKTNPEHVQSIREGLASLKPFECTILNYSKNGASYWIKLQISPIFNDQKELTHFLGIQTDVSTYKEQEEQLLKYAEDLKVYNRRLVSFNHIVSHNLINQINNVHSLTQIATRALPAKEGDLLTQSSTKLVQTVNHLKQLLKGQAGDQKWLNNSVNLTEVIEKVLSTYQSEISNFNIDVKVDTIESVVITSNLSFVESIIENLISNAIKYRRPEVKSHIDILVNKTSKTTTIVVKDNGRGINLSSRGEELFDIFNPVDPTPHSMGLGLHMVKTQVDELGGSVSVESQLGQGSTFTVVLPIRPNRPAKTKI